MNVKQLAAIGGVVLLGAIGCPQTAWADGLVPETFCVTADLCFSPHEPCVQFRICMVDPHPPFASLNEVATFDNPKGCSSSAADGVIETFTYTECLIPGATYSIQAVTCSASDASGAGRNGSDPFNCGKFCYTVGTTDTGPSFFFTTADPVSVTGNITVNAAPEVDTDSAAAPMALVLAGLALVADKGRKAP